MARKDLEYARKKFSDDKWSMEFKFNIWKTVKELGADDSFGEKALLEDEKRSATIKCVG
jgi:hypothetical protein